MGESSLHHPNTSTNPQPKFPATHGGPLRRQPTEYFRFIGNTGRVTRVRVTLFSKLRHPSPSSRNGRVRTCSAQGWCGGVRGGGGQPHAAFHCGAPSGGDALHTQLFIQRLATRRRETRKLLYAPPRLHRGELPPALRRR